jgi:hypothetical protein
VNPVPERAVSSFPQPSRDQVSAGQKGQVPRSRIFRPRHLRVTQATRRRRRK